MPLRHLTHAAFAVSNYGRKLSLTISHDPRWIDDADGRELLESFARQLKTSLAQSNGVATEGFAARHSSENAPVTMLSQPQTVGAS